MWKKTRGTGKQKQKNGGEWTAAVGLSPSLTQKIILFSLSKNNLPKTGIKLCAEV